MKDTRTITEAAPAREGLRLVLIDGSGFIFRAFHALPPMTDPAGVPVNAVFGFTNMLARLLKDHVGTHVAVIFDAGAKTFRNRLYDGYKAQRPPPPEELVPQFALVREATEAFGVPAIELADWEADDLIAAYAAAAKAGGGEALIVSSDKDLMQLISPGVSMLDPIKNRPIGPAEVVEKFGVPPEKLIDAQALMGDSVDNVPGVPGIGPKTAAQLIGEFGDLEGVLAAAAGMKPSKRRDLLLEHAAAARLSRDLVTLRADAPLPVPLADLAARAPDGAVLGAFLARLGFRSTLHRLGLEVPAAEAAGAAGAVPTEAPAEVPFGPYAALRDAAALAAFLEGVAASGVLALAMVAAPGPALRTVPVGWALATAPGRAAYLPLRHSGDLADGAETMMAPEAAMALLAPVFADGSVLKILFDGKRVLHAVRPQVVAPVDDVQLMAYALEAGAHGFGLAELISVHLGRDVPAAEALTGSGRGKVGLEFVPVAQAVALAEWADAMVRLWAVLRPALRTGAALSFYEHVDRRLLARVAEMERAGVMVDRAELQRLSVEFAGRMATMETEIHALAGVAFNLGSPKQLGEILFDTLKLPGGKRMKTGAWGTDASVLQTLAEEGHELPARVLEWRQIAKLKSTYADALVEEIDPATGRVHTCFAMAATTTGRLSSIDPNLQNIPIRTEEGGRIRRAFVAPAGRVLVSADYSQIELRLLAHVADLPGLRESFRQGEDIHARTASEVFGVPMAGMDGATRRRAKAINFGIIYGISAFGLARQLQITPGEAKAYIDAYFARYPGIRTYMETTRDFAKAHGFVVTPFARRCWIAGIGEKNPARRAYAERQAINAPLQGGAADIIKRAMVRLPRALREAGLGATLLLQVHDELLLEAEAGEADRVAMVAKRVMEAAAVLTVPLVVETGMGASWADAH